MSDAPRGLRLEELRETAATGIVAGAFELLTQRWRTYLGGAATVLVPVSLLEAYLLRDLPPPQPDDTPEQIAQYASISGVFGLALIFVILPLLSAGFSRAMAASRIGEEVAVDETYRLGGRWFVPVLGALLLAACAVMLGMLALIVPGIYLSVRLYVAVPAVVVEGAGSVEALRRSWALTAERFWHVLGVVLLTALLVLGLSVAVDLVVTWSGLAEGPWFVTGLVDGLISSFVLPFGIAVVLVVYLAQRVRREQLDEAGLAADLARSARA